MKSTFALLALISVSVFGCTDSDMVAGDGPDAATGTEVDASTPSKPDAAPVVFDCADTSGDVADNLVVSGLVMNLVDDKPVANASISAKTSADDLEVAKVTSDVDGAYALNLATGGAPWKGYFSVEEKDHLKTFVYPNSLTRDLSDVPLPLLTESQRFLASALVGITLEDGQGAVVAMFADCDRLGVPGVAFELSPAVEDFYYIIGETADPSATETDGNGAAVALNVPPGQVKVTANLGGTIVENTVESVADAVTIAIFLP